jgi:short subunit dehydrogenase-like uncharacterized protein
VPNDTEGTAGKAHRFALAANATPTEMTKNWRHVSLLGPDFARWPLEVAHELLHRVLCQCVGPFRIFALPVGLVKIGR